MIETPLVYDQVADQYHYLVESGALIHDFVLPLLFTLVGSVEAQQVLDLACGQGIVARALAERGAQVVGVDQSPRLLAIARRLESKPGGVTYVLDDAQRLGTLPSSNFDGVVCHMGLTDISDLAATAETVSRVLKPGGWFVYAIPHPCFQTPDSDWGHHPDGVVRAEVGGYFHEGFRASKQPQRYSTLVGGAHHRTLGTYLNIITRAGLRLEQVLEPQATDSFAQRKPGYAQVAGVWLQRCRKEV
jgi:ubiquinone/menaquinone biosynthesis C-methylase UbiE